MRVVLASTAACFHGVRWRCFILGGKLVQISAVRGARRDT